MKLGLSEVQQREICRVMLQCTGNVSIILFLYNTMYLILLFFLNRKKRLTHIICL